MHRLKIELIDPEQDRAANDQRETHDPRIEQIAFDIAAGSGADDGSRQERDQYADHETARRSVAFEQVQRDMPQLAEVKCKDRQNGAELDQHGEALPEIVLAQIEEAFREQQMPR